MELTKVAAAQISPVFMDRQKTLEKAHKAIENASKKGAKLIVFPEAFVPGYPDWIWLVKNSARSELDHLYSLLLENSVSVNDPSITQLCHVAKECSINVVLGVNEINSEASSGSLYNSILFIDDEGRLLGTHRKLIPTSAERLVWGMGDGTSLYAFDTSVGKLGGLICWENLMPLARFSLYMKGTKILASPTWDRSPKWLTSIQHIAREGGMFLISCCMPLKLSDIPDDLEFKKLYPNEKEWINIGNSCIVNPFGEIIAGPIAEKEEILYADIDFSDIQKAKRMFDVAGHYARPDVFAFSVHNSP